MLKEITAAGKTCYTEASKTLVTPQDFIKKKIDDKLNDLGWKPAG